jgi:hypothetical protein
MGSKDGGLKRDGMKDADSSPSAAPSIVHTSCHRMNIIEPNSVPSDLNETLASRLPLVAAELIDGHVDLVLAWMEAFLTCG